MRKLVNGIYVTVSDLDQTDNLERSESVQDAHEIMPNYNGVATTGGQNASLLSNGKRIFSRAVVRMRAALAAEGWNEGTVTIPRGHHVVLKMRDGSEVQAFRSRSMIVYDVRTGGVVDYEQVVMWRKV